MDLNREYAAHQLALMGVGGAESEETGDADLAKASGIAGRMRLEQGTLCPFCAIESAITSRRLTPPARANPPGASFILWCRHLPSRIRAFGDARLPRHRREANPPLP